MKNIHLRIEGKPLSLDFDAHFNNVVKINQTLNEGAYQQYKQTGLTYVDVPEIVGITGACENVDTLFKVNNRFDIPLFFTQTGQLSLEQALQSLPGVFTVIHSGRDEEEEDNRHLRQFRLTEEEFDCTLAGMTRKNYDEEKMFVTLLSHIQHTVKSMIGAVLKSNSTVLKKVYKRNISKLEKILTSEFLRISYEDAITLLNQHHYPEVTFGDDLNTEHEAKIVSVLNKKGEELPVFITRYPKEIKFFNMKVSTKDPKVVLSADLILPFSGESTGSAVREHVFQKLNNRLITSTMYKLHLQRGGKYEDFGWYLNIIKNKRSNPHAGYGIGNERVLQYIFGETDIRNVSLFFLLNQQTGDWTKKKYGQAAIITAPKKHILLTIGKPRDKELLLPSIKKLAQKQQFILYATENTHLFLKKHGILTSLVYKVSEFGKTPNISTLLSNKVFDLIINTPRREKMASAKEFTDGKLIRKGAVALGIALITDPEVAEEMIKNLS